MRCGGGFDAREYTPPSAFTHVIDTYSHSLTHSDTEHTSDPSLARALFFSYTQTQGHIERHTGTERYTQGQGEKHRDREKQTQGQRESHAPLPAPAAAIPEKDTLQGHFAHNKMPPPPMTIVGS